jgi:hypothetical protein
VSDSYDPLTLLKLIEKIILKQSDNQYKIGIIMEQLKLLLAYRQDDGVTNAAYYDRFKTRIDVAEHIGVSFDNPVLWDWKSQELYSVGYDLLSDLVREGKVKEDVKQAFLAYLFFINSNDKKHSQLKKTVANDHDGEAFPSSCHAALTLMNDFKPLIIEGPAPVAAQGTAFAQKQKGAGTTILPSQDGSNQERTCDETNNARPRTRTTSCSVRTQTHRCELTRTEHHRCELTCTTSCSRSRVKIKANKQVTSPRSEVDQGETQRETAGRLISFWPFLLGVVRSQELHPQETLILGECGFCGDRCGGGGRRCGGLFDGGRRPVFDILTSGIIAGRLCVVAPSLPFVIVAGGWPSA